MFDLRISNPSHSTARRCNDLILSASRYYARARERRALSATWARKGCIETAAFLYQDALDAYDDAERKRREARQLRREIVAAY